MLYAQLTPFYFVAEVDRFKQIGGTGSIGGDVRS